jgi:hypothetical protein
MKTQLRKKLSELLNPKPKATMTIYIHRESGPAKLYGMFPSNGNKDLDIEVTSIECAQALLKLQDL